jgi:hypothetical protein
MVLSDVWVGEATALGGDSPLSDGGDGFDMVLPDVWVGEATALGGDSPRLSAGVTTGGMTSVTVFDNADDDSISSSTVGESSELSDSVGIVARSALSFLVCLAPMQCRAKLETFHSSQKLEVLD